MACINKKKAIFYPLILAVAVLIGVVLGMNLGSNSYQPIINVGRATPQTKLGAILSLIDAKYVEDIMIDSITEEFIPQILAKLDPHSVYMPAATAKSSSESLEGQFDGVGIMFNMATDTIVVQNVISGGPSEKVGIIPGDRIISINDTIVAGKQIDQQLILKMLRGKRKTTVKLGVERQGADKMLSLAVVRDKILVKSVNASLMIDPNIGYIKLLQFSRNSHKEFVEAVNKLKAEGMEHLIFDLTANGGGFLDQAVLIANEFLPEGALIVYTEGRKVKREKTFADGSGSLVGLDVTLLIDEGSASSSEIVAGALQDNDIGTIIGRRSFGKGLVQQQIPFTDGSVVNLTIARYHTPSGRCIQRSYENGIDYAADLATRFEHQELFSADSIKLVDSLKYYTQGGRVVYGGGGIMPDIFVGLDTTRLGDFVAKGLANNLLLNYTLRYTDTHRKELKSLTSLDKAKEYFSKEGNAIYDGYIKYCANSGVVGLPQGVTEELFVRACLYGYIARNSPMEDNGFYLFMYPIYDTVKAAFGHIKDGKPAATAQPAAAEPTTK